MVVDDPSDMLTLRAKGLCKTYKGRPIVDQINLHVHKGEVVALLGPNGAGKTTCFGMIAGLVSADAGQVFLGHLDMSGLPLYMRARFGMRYLPQEISIFRSMTVEDNLLSICELFEKDPAKRQAKVQALLDEFDLNVIRGSMGRVLSGGERRRVEIARCLIGDPHFILLDEPLAGIDPRMIQNVRDLILKLKQKHIGVLITDHNVRDTLSVIDRAYILGGGHIFKEGTPDEIVKDQRVRDVYLGDHFSF